MRISLFSFACGFLLLFMLGYFWATGQATHAPPPTRPPLPPYASSPGVTLSTLSGIHWPRILIFTKMTGYVHRTLPDCLRNLRGLCERNGIAADNTSDASIFTDEGLKPYRVLVFLDASGTLFTPEQRDAFVRYIHQGGGFVGIHAAATAESKWPWYRELVGARFLHHPWVQTGLLTIPDPTDPTVQGLPSSWKRADEWYTFDQPPQNVVPILQVGETRWHGEGIIETGTHAGPVPVAGSPESVIAPHLIAWRHEFEGGRAFYTAVGHFGEAYVEPEIETHLINGIRWAGQIPPAKPYRILIFNKTMPKAYHDKGIPAATAALQALGVANGYVADVDSDGSRFTPESLKNYRVLVFLNVCGDHVLDDAQRQALKGYIEAGGGFVGIHATAAAEKDWPWFTGLLGAQLKTDKHFEPATVRVADPHHFATAYLPGTFTHSDQWFQLKEPPTDVHVLLTADSSQFTGLGLTDPNYPIAWCHEYDGGRAFFTTFGHETLLSEPAFANQLLGAIDWARGASAPKD